MNGKPKAIVMRIHGDPKEVLDFIEKQEFKWLLRSYVYFIRSHLYRYHQETRQALKGTIVFQTGRV
ncbi:MAG TPA: hypothetical protein PLP64_10630 [Pseudothermotoga sp.]|nr:hypothetical protein [Pseudothermotoga sp.]